MFNLNLINMKRKTTLLILFILFLLRLPADGQNPVPNSGFENWTWTANPPYNPKPEPANWTTYNNFCAGNYTVVLDSPGYAGNYAIKLIVKNIPGLGNFPGLAYSGFPIGFRANSIIAQAKFNKMPGDSVYIVMSAYQGGSPVGGGVWSPTVSTSANYIQIIAPVTYSNGTVIPDSVYMALQAGSPTGLPQIGTYLTVDELELSTSSVGIEDVILNEQIQVFPNPVSERLNIIANDGIIILKSEIVDLAGKKHFDVSINSAKAEFDLSSISSGMYLVKLVSKSGKMIHKKILVTK